MLNKNFILHLTLIDGIGPAIIQRIMELQRSGAQASDLYLFSTADWQQRCGFTVAAAQKLVAGLANKKIVDEEFILIERNNVQWITIIDEMYPSLLREIYLPPIVLYFQGSFFSDRFDYPERANKMIAVVGARKADNYGERIIDQIIPDLVAAHYSIISGGAQGIDTMAHRAALKSGGKTIAVLGSGLLRPYPSSNKQLFKTIIENGGNVMSSFPLRAEPLQGNFPARNRIITGLSRGCLVVQAAKKSGALISAHYAMEQGREVFAIPGPVDSELSVGCNVLIQNGAKLVMNAADILEEFGDRVIIDNRVVQEKAMQMSLESVIAPTESMEFNSFSVRYGSTSSPRTVTISSSVCPDASSGSAVNAALSSLPVRPDLVEGNELKQIKKYSNYSSQQKLIIAACKHPSSFDAIVTNTQLPIEVVQSELFNLQFDGIVSQDFTGMWSVD